MGLFKGSHHGQFKWISIKGFCILAVCAFILYAVISAPQKAAEIAGTSGHAIAVIFDAVINFLAGG